jgi:hypothetical protein
MLHPATFLVGCIGTRLLLAYLAYYLLRKPLVWLRVLGVFLLIPAIGFALIFAFGWRKTGPETAYQPIWWNALRPVHSALYFAAALSAFFAKTRHLVWMFLLADAILGLGAYIFHRAWIHSKST